MRSREDVPPAASLDAPSVVRATATALAVNGITGMPYLVLAAAAVQVRADLGFDEAVLGLLLAMFPVGGLLASPFVGRLVDRLGSLRGMRTAAWLVIPVALAVALTPNALGLGIAGLVGGVAIGFASPAANRWLSRTVAGSRRGIALAIKQSSNPVGSIVAGLAVPVVVLTFGWRWAFVGLAVMAATIVAWLPRSQPPGGAPRARPSDGEPRIRHAPGLLLLSVAAALGFAGQSPLLAFYVSSVVRDGVPEGMAGVMLAVGGAAALLTRLAAGVMVDRRPRGFLRAMVVMLGLGAALTPVMLTGRPTLILVATPILFLTVNGWTGLLHLAVVQTHPEDTGSATGVVMVGCFVGTIVGPVLFGVVAGTSYTAAWAMAAVMLGLAALATQLSRSRLRAGVALGMVETGS